jgi:phenylpropionate dioxygenase-like ring-hydroxylating dioxygenase large terminal subunit
LDYSRAPYRDYHDPEAYQREQQRLFHRSTWKCLRLDTVPGLIRDLIA